MNTQYKEFFEQDLMISVRELKESLLPNMSIVNVERRHDLFLDRLYFIESGFVAVKGIESGNLFGFLHHPSFFGFTTIYGATLPLKIEVINESKIYEGEPSLIKKIITEKQLEKFVIFMLISSIDELYKHDIIIGMNDAYGSIKLALEQFYSWPIEIVKSTNVADYLIKITGLSRSRVMSILSELKRGGYLKIENGKLQNLNKLPYGF